MPEWAQEVVRAIGGMTAIFLLGFLTQIGVSISNHRHNKKTLKNTIGEQVNSQVSAQVSTAISKPLEDMAQANLLMRQTMTEAINAQGRLLTRYEERLPELEKDQLQNKQLLSALLNDKASLLELVQNLQGQINTLTASSNEHTRIDHERGAQIADLNAKLGQFSASLEAAQTDLANTKAALQDATDKLAETERLLNEANERIKQMESEHNAERTQWASDRQRLDNELITEREKVANLQKQLNEQSHVVEELQSKVSKMETGPLNPETAASAEATLDPTAKG